MKSGGEPSSAQAPQSLSQDRAPYSRILEKFLIPLDHLFDRIYTSQFNPIYRSGTLVVALLLIVLVTGFYLLFFYRTEAPYESIVAIQKNVFLGSLMRAVHRYASDGAMIALFLHILRVLVEGKTHGPRFLAWFTGIILAGVLFFSGATGYVMVWDRFAQIYALEGARMVDLLPIFPAPMAMTFDGLKELPPPSFFFMNLFLHVALPLAMIFGLWIHTKRMARSQWLPEKKIFLGIIGAFITAGIVIPAVVQPQADLLKMPFPAVTDFFFGFWLKIGIDHGAWASVFFWTTTTLFLFSIPFWWRPKRGIATSTNNPATCLACEQCVIDCPYEAISMVPGQRMPRMAWVDPELCVGCGLCGGSCSTYSIGPNQRTGKDQLERVRRISVEANQPIAVIGCHSNPGMAQWLTKTFGSWLYDYPIDCVGNLHPRVVALLQRRFEHLIILSCPERNCRQREGPQLMRARLLEGQSPTEPGMVDLSKITLLAASLGERRQVQREIEMLLEEVQGLDLEKKVSPRTDAIVRWLKGFGFTGLLMALIVGLSAFPLGGKSEKSLLRISFRLPGQKLEKCRDAGDELAHLPRHMQVGKICEVTFLSYQLKVEVDQATRIEREIKPPGMRGDRPMSVSEELLLPAGSHHLKISFVAKETLAADTHRVEQTVEFKPGDVVLVSYSPELRTLILK